MVGPPIQNVRGRQGYPVTLVSSGRETSQKKINVKRFERVGHGQVSARSRPMHHSSCLASPSTITPPHRYPRSYRRCDGLMVLWFEIAYRQVTTSRFLNTGARNHISAMFSAAADTLAMTDVIKVGQCPASTLNRKWLSAAEIVRFSRSLSGVKRSWLFAVRTSAFYPKADIASQRANPK